VRVCWLGVRSGVFVEGLTEVTVRSPQEVWALAAKGQRARQTAATRLNDVSSRSHAVFTVVVEQRMVHKPDGERGGGGGGGSSASSSAGASTEGKASAALKLSRLNLVDLAGSERAAMLGEIGERLEESKKIVRRHTPRPRHAHPKPTRWQRARLCIRRLLRAPRGHQ
jgi:hypothetical protein